MRSLPVSLVYLGIFTWSLTHGFQSTVEKRQVDNVCINPSEDPSYPAVCTETSTAIDDALMNLDILQPPSVLNEASANFTNKLSVFCTEQCVRPHIDYFTCLESTSAVQNLVDGTCSTNGQRFCIPLILDGISGGQTSLSIYDSLFLQDCTVDCTTNCFDILESTVNYLGCCAHGVFSAEASHVLESCQVAMPDPCPSNFTMQVTAPTVATTPTVETAPTTPPPEDCIDPEVDPNYPVNCIDALAAINTKLAKLFGADFTIQEVDESLKNISELLVVYCGSECLQPNLDYLQCLVEDNQVVESLASFQCGGENGEDFCLVQILRGLSGGTIPVGIFGTTFAESCTANCTSGCRDIIISLMEDLGCCTRGLFSDPALFQSCELAIPENCPPVTLPTTDATTPTERTPPTERPRPTERTVPTEELDGSDTELNPAVGSAPSTTAATVLLAALCITTVKMIL